MRKVVLEMSRMGVFLGFYIFGAIITSIYVNWRWWNYCGGWRGVWNNLGVTLIGAIVWPRTLYDELTWMRRR